MSAQPSHATPTVFPLGAAAANLAEVRKHQALARWAREELDEILNDLADVLAASDAPRHKSGFAMRGTQLVEMLKRIDEQDDAAICAHALEVFGNHGEELARAGA